MKVPVVFFTGTANESAGTSREIDERSAGPETVAELLRTTGFLEPIKAQVMFTRDAISRPAFLSTIGPLRSSGRSATECRLRPELSNLPHAAKMGCPADQETEIRSGP